MCFTKSAMYAGLVKRQRRHSDISDLTIFLILPAQYLVPNFTHVLISTSDIHLWKNILSVIRKPERKIYLELTDYSFQVNISVIPSCYIFLEGGGRGEGIRLALVVYRNTQKHIRRILHAGEKIWILQRERQIDIFEPTFNVFFLLDRQKLQKWIGSLNCVNSCSSKAGIFCISLLWPTLQETPWIVLSHEKFSSSCLFFPASEWTILCRLQSPYDVIDILTSEDTENIWTRLVSLPSVAGAQNRSFTDFKGCSSRLWKHKTLLFGQC